VGGGGVVGGAGVVGGGLPATLSGFELSPPPQAPRTDRAARLMVICNTLLDFMENMVAPLVKPCMENVE
jgi:hypothetical protein